MVAIGRALMSNPSVLLCDELSLGLAPIVIKEIYDALPAICAEGMTRGDRRAGRGDGAARCRSGSYCFQEGRVSLQGASGALTREQISQAYFGAVSAMMEDPAPGRSCSAGCTACSRSASR